MYGLPEVLESLFVCACDIYVILRLSGNMHCIGVGFDLINASYYTKLFLIFINTV